MKTILHLHLLTFLLSQTLPKCIAYKYNIEKTCEKKNIEKDLEEDEAYKIVFNNTNTHYNYKTFFNSTSNHNIHSVVTIHHINLKIATPPPKETVVYLPI